MYIHIHTIEKRKRERERRVRFAKVTVLFGQSSDVFGARKGLHLENSRVRTELFVFVAFAKGGVKTPY